MGKIKYREAKYLCKYDLDTEFLNELELNINDLWPTRNIFILDCEEGKKILKLINYNNEKLEFIVDILEYLKIGYDGVLSINRFKDGKYKIERNEKSYVLLDLIAGVECNLNNPMDLEAASKAIANLHLAGQGVLSKLDKYKKKISLGNLKERFEEGIVNLEKCKELASLKTYKNEFDELFLENVDYNLGMMNSALEFLEKSKYKELCKNEDYVTVCHNDLAYHNMIVNDGKVNFIDFDYANIDLRILDVYNFTFKTLKKHAFDINIYNQIIADYNSILKLTNDEMELLYILFLYPGDFCTVSKNYYFALKDWRYESFFNKLENKVLHKKEKELLIAKIYLNNN
ncbi:MAG: CotS family spore coat protein [Sarcina sp.]